MTQQKEAKATRKEILQLFI